MMANNNPNFNDIEIDGTPFNVLMQQAAEMKTQELAQNRRYFDSLPVYFQHSLYSKEDVIAAQDETNFEKKKEFSLFCKDKGNELFHRNQFLYASLEYERSLAVWDYLRSVYGSDWKTKVCLTMFLSIHLCDSLT